MYTALHCLKRPLFLSVLLGLGLYAGAMIAGDMNAVTEGAIQLGLAGWSLVLGLSLFNYALRFLRWHRYLARLGEQMPFGLHLVYYLAGFAFTTTPGKAGEAVRCLYLKRHAVDYSHSLSALFVERLVDVVAMALLALSAVWTYQNARLPVIVAAALALGLLPLVRHPGLQGALGRFAEKVQPGRPTTAIRHIGSLLRASAELLKARALYGGLTIGLIAWGAEGVGFWVILSYLDAPIPLLLAVGIYAVGILAGALSFIPGGLGSTEAVMVVLLGLAGIDTSTALAATLICRIATLWFAVGIGLAAMAALEIGGRRISRINADTGT